MRLEKTPKLITPYVFYVRYSQTQTASVQTMASLLPTGSRT